MIINFLPSKHGFHFGNNFVNKIIHTSFGKIESRGRCGGMAFASLDYYFSNMDIPTHESKDFPNKKVPPDGSMLADYIYERSIHSLFTLSSFKFFDWSLKRNIDNTNRRSVSYKTKHEEFPKLKRSIDSGKPVVLGLIGAARVTEICNNHQVVAYGYDFDPKNEKIVIYIYDSNAHDREITLESHKDIPYFKESNGQEWRAFFVQEYHFKHPKYQDLIITENKAVSTLETTYTVKSIGQFTANTKHIPKFNNISNVELSPGEEKIIALLVP